MAEERGLKVDLEGFEHEMEQARERSRAAGEGVDTRAMLKFIENVIYTNPHIIKWDYYRSDLLRILRHLAYDAQLFNGCINQILKLAEEDKYSGHNSSADVFKSLFTIRLSGTWATVDQRIEVVERMLKSKVELHNRFGLLALKAMLGTSGFTSAYPFEFGARSRDYGYQPSGKLEVQNWYTKVIDLCKNHLFGDNHLATAIRTALERSLSTLWVDIKLYNQVEEILLDLNKSTEYYGGWLAVKGIFRFQRTELDEEGFDRLTKLEKKLRPTNLGQELKALLDQNAYSRPQYFFVDPELRDEDPAESDKRKINKLEDLGKALFHNLDTFYKLLPDIISSASPYTRYIGEGFSIASKCSEEHWNFIKKSYSNTNENGRYPNFLIGFLKSCYNDDKELYNEILDQSLNEPSLRPIIPQLHSHSELDEKAINRLHEALDNNMAPLSSYTSLSSGTCYDSISDDQLAEIVIKMVDSDGFVFAAELIWYRFFRKSRFPSQKVSNQLIEAGRYLLNSIDFSLEYKDVTLNNHGSVIIESCFVGEDGRLAASIFCNAIFDATKNLWGISKYGEILQAIGKVQPFVFLDTFLDKSNETAWDYSNDLAGHYDPLSQLAESQIIAWCNSEPKRRYPLIAKCCILGKKGSILR
jgi:hypothetical protein